MYNSHKEYQQSSNQYIIVTI